MSEEQRRPTIEELIAIATADTHPMERAGDLSEVQRFCIANEIVPGTVRNKAKDIYDLYKKWAKRPINKFTFGRQMMTMFETARTGAGRYYLLDRKLNEPKKETGPG